MTLAVLSSELVIQGLAAAEAVTEGQWPDLSADQKERMSLEDLTGYLLQKADMLRRPGATHVRPTATDNGTLRFRVLTSFVDDRFPDEPATRSAIGMMFARNGLHIEMRDFDAHRDGGDVLTSIHVNPTDGSVDYHFFDDSGAEIEEKDSLRDILLDAHDVADAIKAAKKQDTLREHDLTGLFRSHGMRAAGTIV
jgi:hypothetical protein